MDEETEVGAEAVEEAPAEEAPVPDGGRTHEEWEAIVAGEADEEARAQAALAAQQAGDGAEE